LNFKNLLEKAGAELTSNSYRLQCHVGSNSIALDYVRDNNKTLESVFGNESNAKVDLIKIYAAGSL
jgi:hypothetical protein